MVPRGATILPNRIGTAPGQLFERDGKFVIVMPGVPGEMESIVQHSVVPFLKSKIRGSVILHRTLRTTGLPESQLAQRLGDIGKLLDGGSLAFLPYLSGVRLRITVSGTERALCEEKIREIERSMREKIQKYVYGTDEMELEEAVGIALRERRLRIATAESCTGGLIASKLTDIPGSSDYVERGVVAYSNRSKTEMLNVPGELIEQRGAVSKEVAEAMARGIRAVSNADIGISTTGIAGPAGGSAEKPVGLVWIGYSDADETLAVQFHFGQGRLRNKERATYAALELVRRKILNIT
jgi:nicotinamide-nucleotide amidase